MALYLPDPSGPLTALHPLAWGNEAVRSVTCCSKQSVHDRWKPTGQYGKFTLEKQVAIGKYMPMDNTYYVLSLSMLQCTATRPLSDVLVDIVFL